MWAAVNQEEIESLYGRFRILDRGRKGYLTGEELLNIPEGRWIGELMNTLSKERAFGRLKNKEEAFEFTRYWWKHNNPFCD